ncbi:uncharacterized protein DS421_6g186430 [Arachis hypogaea]|nr:uncharacterized protein DS421_6g186430 [Arachis hypogaea]
MNRVHNIRFHHSIRDSEFITVFTLHSIQISEFITVFRVHQSITVSQLSLRARKEPSGFNVESSGDGEWESGRQTATPTRVVTELTSRRSSLPCGRVRRHYRIRDSDLRSHFQKIRREKENREEEDYPHSLSIAVHHIVLAI